jgi:PIN domain nuclease of toxin-antitoxin system
VRLLLDTHVVIWALTGARLSKQARTAIQDPDNTVVTSAASLWEMSIKAGLGRLTMPANLLAALVEQDIGLLAVSGEHALEVRDLPDHHRDPFDRMIVAQARHDGFTVVTRDPDIQQYDVLVLRA